MKMTINLAIDGQSEEYTVHVYEDEGVIQLVRVRTDEAVLKDDSRPQGAFAGPRDITIEGEDITHLWRLI